MSEDLAQSRPGARELSGTEKAAALLLAMEAPPASRILKRLDAYELREITRAAAQLGALQMATLEAVIHEFTEDFSVGANLLGDVARAQALLTDAVPLDQVESIMSDVLGVQQSNVWELLSSIPENTFATFLKGEHPLTTTYILSRVDPTVTAKVVPHFPREMRNEILCHMISPPQISDVASRVIETALRQELLGSGARSTTSDNRAKIAKIINSLEPADAEDVMRQLAEKRPKDAKILKTMMFSFNDLPRLSLRARALLFDKLATDTVVLSLRGMNSEFCDAVLSSMASRSRRLVESELANPSNTPAREITKARKQVTDLVLAMAQRNEIEIAAAEDAQEQEGDA